MHNLLRRTTSVHDYVAASRAAVATAHAPATAILAVTAARFTFPSTTAFAAAWNLPVVQRPVPCLRKRLRSVPCQLPQPVRPVEVCVHRLLHDLLHRTTSVHWLHSGRLAACPALAASHALSTAALAVTAARLALAAA